MIKIKNQLLIVFGGTNEENINDKKHYLNDMFLFDCKSNYWI